MTVIQLFGLDQSTIGEPTFEVAFGGMLEGVCLGYSDECRVYVPLPFVGMRVFVRTGLLCVGGVFVHVTAEETLIVNASDALPRYDRVVARRDNNTNTVWIGVKTGTPAAAPIPPYLIRTGGIYEISLARVLVEAGDVSITYDEIIDERGEPSLCGYMSFKAYEQVQRAAIEGWRQKGRWSAQANAAAPEASGLYESLVTTHNASALVQDADGIGLQQDTSGALNDDAFVRSDIIHRTSYNTLFECKFKLAQTAAERVYVGLSQAVFSATLLGSDLPPGSLVGLHYSTSRGDTNFMFLTQTVIGPNLIDSGIPIDTAAHIIRIITTPTYVIFELMDTDRNIEASARVVTNLPLPTNDLAAWSGIRALEVAVKSLTQYYAEGTHRNI